MPAWPFWGPPKKPSSDPEGAEVCPGGLSRARRDAHMADLRDAFLVGYVRTPFGRADPRRGVFRQVRSDDLAVLVLRDVLRRAGVSADAVDGVILGAVEMMGEQAHPGTAIPYLAGFPERVVGLSVERACTTAMMSVHIATMQIQCGLGDLYVAGGLDSMTHFRIPTIKDGMNMEDVIKEGGHMLGVHEPESEAVRAHQSDRAERRARRRAARRSVPHLPRADGPLGAGEPPAGDRGAGTVARGDRPGRGSRPRGPSRDGGARSGTSVRHDLRENRGAGSRLQGRRQDHRRHVVRPGRRRGRLSPRLGRCRTAARADAAGSHPYHRDRRVRAHRSHLLRDSSHTPGLRALRADARAT